MTRGRRNALRSLCADLLKIRWTDESGAGRREVATLEDISPTGASLKVENSIPVGNNAHDPLSQRSIPGASQALRSADGLVFCGCGILRPGYRWSKEQYEPAHLLQFRFRAGKQAKAKPPKSVQ